MDEEEWEERADKFASQVNEIVNIVMDSTEVKKYLHHLSLAEYRYELNKKLLHVIQDICRDVYEEGREDCIKKGPRFRLNDKDSYR